MPRKPKGERAMTGAERAKAFRARKVKKPTTNPMDEPIESLPSWRNLAKPGSLLKGAK